MHRVKVQGLIYIVLLSFRSVGLLAGNITWNGVLFSGRVAGVAGLAGMLMGAAF